MILWALALVIFVMNLGFSIVIPVIPDLLGNVAPNLPREQILLGEGIFFSGFNLAKIAAQVPSGSFADRFGERRVVILSVVLYALSLVFLIEARDFPMLYGARMLEGIATGVSYPAVTSIVMSHSPPEKLGWNMSLQVFAGGFGFVMGPLFCNWIAENKWFGLEHDPYRPLHFMLWFTVIGGGLALVAFLLAPKKPRRELAESPPIEVAAVAASEPLLAAQPLPVETEHKKGCFGGMWTEVRLLLRFSTSVPLLFFIAPMLIDKGIITTMLAAVPEHGKTLHLNERVPPYLLAGLGGIFALCQPIAGWIADRTSPRRLVFAMLLGMTGALVGLAIAWNEASFIPFFGIYAIFASILMTVSMKQVTSMYLEKEGKGRVAGVVLSVTDIGTVLGPACYMWVYGHLSPALGFITMAITAAAATVAFWFSEGREKDMPTV